MDWSSHIGAAILSFQLFVGGQARLPFSPTPSLQKITADQADGFKDALAFIPLDAPSLMQAIGWLLLAVAFLVAWPATRARGCLLSGLISLTFCYVHASMDESNVLPVINVILAALISTKSR